MPASGFGKTIVETFATEGAKVVVADINGQGARDVAQSLGASAVHVAVDVSKRGEGDVAALVRQVVTDIAEAVRKHDGRPSGGYTEGSRGNRE